MATISIHAPLTGSDKQFRSHIPERPYFNPRSPYGERPSGTPSESICAYFNPRSPYGERLLQPGRQHNPQDFNPRSPYGERPTSKAAIQAMQNFNPRSPYGERPVFADPVSTQPVISIHAPLTGSDYQRQRRPKRPTNFNPRSPYGERQLFRRLFLAPSGFQSTLPLRGATFDVHQTLSGILISIHAPLTGSDSPVPSDSGSVSNFNPRSPYGERPAG